MRTFIIAEIGINHNGNMEIAKDLIKAAKNADCDAVKFQKRTIDVVYTQEFLDGYRESPWGNTQRAQKEGLEFNLEQYKEIDSYCKELDIAWFASAWDNEAQKFLRQFNLKYNKIASAMNANYDFLHEVAGEGRYTFISTGMSTYDEIDAAVNIFAEHKCEYELMHCSSLYPMPKKEANLKMIETLRNKYNCKVGYSGHETGRIVSLSAAVLGATSIERHITLDRAMYGSDQAASLEVGDIARLVTDIRILELIIGDGIRKMSEEELAMRKKLKGD
ncbi:MAG: N-acetylneuraminate synthase family protein [Oscillospiraceae bacterium]|jgi:N-acetylneuraminate synthase|nr:N-acetylneuraminate synthase family protein [Oscillospiraceae bacterium]